MREIQPNIKIKILHEILDYLFHPKIKYEPEIKAKVRQYFINLFNLCSYQEEMYFVMLDEIKYSYFNNTNLSEIKKLLLAYEETIEYEFRFTTKLDKFKLLNPETTNLVNKLRLDHIILKG